MQCLPPAWAILKPPFCYDELMKRIMDRNLKELAASTDKEAIAH